MLRAKGLLFNGLLCPAERSVRAVGFSFHPVLPSVYSALTVREKGERLLPPTPLLVILHVRISLAVICFDYRCDGRPVVGFVGRCEVRRVLC